MARPTHTCFLLSILKSTQPSCPSIVERIFVQRGRRSNTSHSSPKIYSMSCLLVVISLCSRYYGYHHRECGINNYNSCTSLVNDFYLSIPYFEAYLLSLTERYLLSIDSSHYLTDIDVLYHNNKATPLLLC